MKRSFEPDIREVPAAREFAASTLRDWNVTCENMALVVTELVTNAMVHACGPVMMELSLHGQEVTVEISDSDAHPPAISAISPTSASGRGLRIVGNLSRQWGVRTYGGNGKVVWAELNVT